MVRSLVSVPREKYFAGCSRPRPGTGRCLPETSSGKGDRPCQPRSSLSRRKIKTLLCSCRDARGCVRSVCAYLEEPIGHQEARLLVRPIPNLDVLGSTLGTNGEQSQNHDFSRPVSSRGGHGQSISHCASRFQERNARCVGIWTGMRSFTLKCLRKRPSTPWGLRQAGCRERQGTRSGSRRVSQARLKRHVHRPSALVHSSPVVVLLCTFSSSPHFHLFLLFEEAGMAATGAATVSSTWNNQMPISTQGCPRGL